MTTTTPTTMDHIESLAKMLAGARTELVDRMQSLRREQDEIKRRRLQGIRNAVARVQAAHEELRLAVVASPALFAKPKTRLLHGIKLGYQKQRGKISWADDDAVIELIKRHFPEQLDTLTRTKRSLVRDALSAMPAKDLRRLGVTVTDDVDAVLIKASDSDIDKLVDALVNDKDLAELVS